MARTTDNPGVNIKTIPYPEAEGRNDDATIVLRQEIERLRKLLPENAKERKPPTITNLQPGQEADDELKARAASSTARTICRMPDGSIRECF